MSNFILSLNNIYPEWYDQTTITIYFSQKPFTYYYSYSGLFYVLWGKFLLVLPEKYFQNMVRYKKDVEKSATKCGSKLRAAQASNTHVSLLTVLAINKLFDSFHAVIICWIYELCVFGAQAHPKRNANLCFRISVMTEMML